MPQIHDDEPDTSQATVRALIAADCPQWRQLALRPVSSIGTSNVLWRLGDEWVVRLPRTPSAAAGLTVELDVPARLAGLIPTPTPQVAHRGTPGDMFPFPWAVLAWLPGRDAWTARAELTPTLERALAVDLAALIRALRAVPLADVSDLPRAAPGERGGPVGELTEVLREWLDEGVGIVDRDRVLRLWEALAAADRYRGSGRLCHGDLIPGNLLLRDGRLAAVIDWGGTMVGDPAADLLPAWTVLGPPARELLRAELECDAAEWARGRAFALQQAVAGVIYYTSRGSGAAAFHARSLAAVLGCGGPPRSRPWCQRGRRRATAGR